MEEARAETKRRKSLHQTSGGFYIREDYKPYIPRSLPSLQKESRTIAQHLKIFYLNNPLGKCLGWKLNRLNNLVHESFYAIAFCRGFYVTLTHNSSEDKHTARLYYHNSENENHWLASFRIKGNFYEKQRVIDEIQLAVRYKKFHTNQTELQRQIAI